jgi:hypothetical protein
MGSALARIRRVKEAQRLLDELIEQRDNVLMIHYSCESFYDRADGRTPRITSIAIRNLGTGQTHSFSIHKRAELEGVAPENIEQDYDRFELAMLREYFEFLKMREGYRWVHWNMRDINFGFAAIEHRFQVLKGKPFVLQDEKKVDLARLLSARFGVRYIGHPRLESLVNKNGITTLNFLGGAEEAAAFEAGEYVRLHQSTLRKVDVLASILERAADGSLRTDAKWREIYGMTPEAIGEALKEHWLATIITFLAGVAGLIALLR